MQFVWPTLEHVARDIHGQVLAFRIQHDFDVRELATLAHAELLTKQLDPAAGGDPADEDDTPFTDGQSLQVKFKASRQLVQAFAPPILSDSALL